MKTRTVIIHASILALFSFGMSGCGGAGGGGDDGDGITIIPITAACTIPDDLYTYQELSSGDIIKNEAGNADLSIFQSDDGVKRVCIRSGNAAIVRQ